MLYILTVDSLVPAVDFFQEPHFYFISQIYVTILQTVSYVLTIYSLELAVDSLELVSYPSVLAIDLILVNIY